MFFLTYLLTFFFDISSDILSDISFDILSDISSNILSDIPFDILSDISSDILSDIPFDMLSDISSDILSDMLKTKHSIHSFTQKPLHTTRNINSPCFNSCSQPSSSGQLGSGKVALARQKRNMSPVNDHAYSGKQPTHETIYAQRTSTIEGKVHLRCI